MKKNIFAKLMMLVMMTAVCITFTACGDGDDDGGSTTGSSEYVAPCLNFGSSVAHVKEYMSGSVWQLSDQSNDVILMYFNEKTSTVINYMFTNGLHMVTVAYVGYSDGKANGFKSEIEKRYGVTMTRENDTSDVNQYVYSCTATINQKKVKVLIHCYKYGISIIYELSD